MALKHRLPIDQASVEVQVDEYNAQACLRMGHVEYIQQEAINFPKPLPPRRLSPLNPPAAGGHVRKAVAGVKVYADWLGSGLKPVEKTKAETRASVCVNCKQNQDPNWIQKMESALANKFKTLIEIKNDLQLKTPHDDRLHSCQICDCPLVVKIHVPIEHVLKDMSEATLNALEKVDPPCWIIEEATQ